MINKNFKVSVIIPTYNRARLLPRAIQSVLNQTYNNFELIIVDDGSIDNTEDVVKKFQKSDPRIIYIKNDKNKGPSASRNIGIEIAKGEYIAFQDSDDEWLPEKIEKQIKFFEDTPLDVGVVYTGFWRIENNKKIYIPFSWIKQKDGYIHKEILKGNFIGTPTILVKKECFKKVGLFDETLFQLEDWELLIRISKDYKFKYVNEALVISYFTPNSVNKQDNIVLLKTLKIIFKKHFNDIKQDKKVFSNYLGNIGHLLCLTGKFKKGRYYLVKSIKMYPLNFKYLCATTLSFLGENNYRIITKTYQFIHSKL